MKSRNRVWISPVVFIAAVAGALLTGCGSQAYTTTPVSSSSTGFGTSTGTPIVTATATPTTTPTPSESFSFAVNGTYGVTPSYVTPQIMTDSILQVTVSAGPASQNITPKGQCSVAKGGCNATDSYDCITYTVTMGGDSVVTEVLSPVPGNAACPSAPQSQMIDFSGQLVSGHGPVTVKVQANSYDYYCQLYWTDNIYGIPQGEYDGWDYEDYCPMHSVYEYSTVTGTLSIAINGT